MQNILIFPSGSENAIEIYQAIHNSVHINAFGASSKSDQSELIYDKPIISLPYINDPGFYEELNGVIKKLNINFIFPTHDTIAYELAKNKDIINCEILTSSEKTNNICRHKDLTYSLFNQDNFNCKTYSMDDPNLPFPLISKPIVGEGAKGIYLISNLVELELFHDKLNSILVEYLPGDEFTVDCFTNFKGELLFSKGRRRAEIKMGMSFKSEMVSPKLQYEIDAIAQRINEKLNFNGLWFFQVKKNADGILKLLEISTRTAGTMMFFRSIGVNLPLLTIFNAMSLEVRIAPLDLSPILYRSTKNRINYQINYDSIYVDYDDTIIIKNKVNYDLMAFLYKSKNNGKKVLLITKHKGDLNSSLNFYNIPISLFDEIYHLKENALKSDYIKEKSSIFIDNWFKERKEVSDKLDIPVFDVDAVEFL